MMKMTAVRPETFSIRRSTSWITLVLWLYFVGSSQAQEELYMPTCRRALGMQSGDIPDSAISASSAYDEKSVGSLNSRIRTERNGGAWCPLQQIAKDVYEWLELDLGGLKVITVVETQGRFGNGQGQEYAPHYLLEYQRREGGRWIRFRNRKGQEILKGNSNTYIAEMREVRPPIITRRIRFLPYSVHPRTICMRVEVYGCEWQDDIVSYRMPQGERRGAEVDLYDFTYDGTIVDQYMSGGLGQLTDWEEGNTNFRLDLQGLGKKGYEWIGWKNETSDTRPVEIVYEFASIRNFTAVKIHCNNLFSKDARVFRAAKIYFSIGGTFFNGEPVEYEYLRDTLIEFARRVTIPIPHRVGKFVKLVLFFDSRWVMISETRFESTPSVGEFAVETEPAPTTSLPIWAPTPQPPLVGGEGNKPDNQILEVNVMPGDPQQDSPKLDPMSSPVSPSSGSMESAEAQPTPNMDNTYIAIIIGTLSALILLLLLVVAAVVIRNRQNKYSSSPLKSVFAADHVNFNLNDLTPGLSSTKLSNGNMYNPISTTESNESSDLDKDGSSGSKDSCNKNREAASLKGKENSYKNLLASIPKVNNQELPENIQCRKLPEVPESPKSSDTCQSGCTYATPDLAKYPPLVVSLPPQPVFQSPPAGGAGREETPPPPPPPHPNPRDVYAAADMVNIQGSSGNSVYSAPNPDLLWGESLSVVELPRDSLKFVEKLGQGQFGEVHLCEAVQLADFLGDDFPEMSTLKRGRSVMVAVKMLRTNASEQARLDFHKEVKIMSRLRDPNIVRVLGVCTAEEPLAVVVEYMKHGDLNQFLLHRLPEGTLNGSNPHTLTLSYGCLIYMSTQIASGMKYLENLNMVHRDLATRNCLVGSLYTIKISDFGMSRSLYMADYYRIEGRAVLPIRWMAWESVLLGKFSCKSDVWSFAVTIWEILTFARDQPFADLSDEQVIENCGHYYRNDHLEANLPPPGNCPKEIFDLMRECWNRDESLRPTFREIHMFLQRKNMGYDPRDELERPPSFGS